MSQLTLEVATGDELGWTYIKKGDLMSLYILVKSILAADPYYQCISPMMPRENANRPAHSEGSRYDVNQHNG